MPRSFHTHPSPHSQHKNSKNYNILRNILSNSTKINNIILIDTNLVHQDRLFENCDISNNCKNKCRSTSQMIWECIHHFHCVFEGTVGDNRKVHNYQGSTHQCTFFGHLLLASSVQLQSGLRKKLNFLCDKERLEKIKQKEL